MAEGNKPIAFIELAAGAGSSAANTDIKKQLITVNSQLQLNNLYSLYLPLAVPQVDFHQNFVIALQMGSHRTGGYSIGVDEIIEEEYAYLINVVSHIPETGCVLTDNLTSPYQFVEIPITTKEIIFVESLIVDICN